MDDNAMPVLPIRQLTTGRGGDVHSDVRLLLSVDALGRAVVPVYRGSVFGRSEVVGYRLADRNPVDPALARALFEHEAVRRRKAKIPK